MVYIDELRLWGQWKYGESCHMMPASHSETDIEELHRFAERIGLKREWFQNGRWPHYDLTRQRRVKALKAGAVEVDTKLYIRAQRGQAVLPGASARTTTTEQQSKLF